MQDEVRKPYKYRITLEVEDGPHGRGSVSAWNDEDKSAGSGKVGLSFSSDQYSSNEYLKNLGEALNAILIHEVTKHINRTTSLIVEEKLNEKLHKKTD